MGISELGLLISHSPLCGQAPSFRDLFGRHEFFDFVAKSYYRYGHCQTKANRYPKVVMHPPSGRKLAPLGQGGGSILFEDIAAVEVAILVEVVVD